MGHFQEIGEAIVNRSLSQILADGPAAAFGR